MKFLVCADPRHRIPPAWIRIPEPARGWPLIALARTLQWQIDVEEYFRQEIETGMWELKIPNRSAKELAGAFVTLLHEVDYAKARTPDVLFATVQSSLKGDNSGTQTPVSQKGHSGMHRDGIDSRNTLRESVRVQEPGIPAGSP